MKINNKGQALVTFILLLPIVTLLFILVIDLGLMGIQRRKISNVMKNTIEYGINHLSNERELKELIDKNIKYDDIDIQVKDGIMIKINYKYKGIFLKKRSFEIKYRGYIENKRIRIEGIK